MKILVAYDGSRSSDQALDDLQKAGLPAENVDVLVISVAEVWMPPASGANGALGITEKQTDENGALAEKRLKVAESSVYEADTLSRHAAKRIIAKFPKWTVSASATHGSPAREILAFADEFKPDLIVVGSQGRNAIGRILLGSISKKILTEAKCSVRIARGKIEVDPLPLRIMIGFDGSRGSQIAVEHVAKRAWGENSEIRLLAAVHSLAPTAIGRFIPPVNTWIREDLASEKHWIKEVAEHAMRDLEESGAKVELVIREGNPKEELVGQAAEWQADSIFLGAQSYASKLDKFLIGSTSAAVSERAHCSVETVRSAIVS